jgi:alpha-tubulin suppressor-like RCC1 family protein
LLFGQISAGLHTCAKTEAGAGYCWGRNDSGELGVGDQADRYQPTPVLGPS